MPPQLTKEVTPADIARMAEEYRELLTKAGVPFKLEQTIADMERRAAEMNGQSVEDWKRSFELSAASAKEAPAPKVARKKPERGVAAVVDKDYFYVDPTNQAISQTWMKIRKEMGIPMNMLLMGPSGCGKTELVKRIGREFDKPVYKIDCAAISTVDKWVGHKELVTDEAGNQVTQYVKSQHLQWLAADGEYEPGVVLYDEINRLPGTMLNVLLPILDGSQRIWVPDLGIYSDVHPDTMIAATANLGVGYSGTHSMDIALMDRFGVIMEATFPPQNEEITVLTKRSGIDEARAKVLVDIATTARRKADDGEVSKYLSTRGLIDCAVWAKAGMKIVDAAAATFLRKFNGEGKGESERAIIQLVVAGKAGSL